MSSLKLVSLSAAAAVLLSALAVQTFDASNVQPVYFYNFHYQFVDPVAGSAFAEKFYADFLPTLPAESKPISAHYGPSLNIQTKLTSDAGRLASYKDFGGVLEFASEDATLSYFKALEAYPEFAKLQAMLAPGTVARIVNVWNPSPSGYAPGTTVYVHTVLYDLGPSTTAAEDGTFERYITALILESPPQIGWAHANIGPASGLVAAAKLPGGKTFAYVRTYTSLDELVNTVVKDNGLPVYAKVLAALGPGTTTSRLDFKYQY